MSLSPSFHGYIGSTKDAVLVIQAVLAKDFSSVHRRPHDRERADLIKLGSVFVFIEELSGIKRWTDGIAWSPLRILGRFLVYRELDKSSLSEKDDKRKRKKHSDPGRRALNDTHHLSLLLELLDHVYPDRRLSADMYRPPTDLKDYVLYPAQANARAYASQYLVPPPQFPSPTQPYTGSSKSREEQRLRMVEDHSLIKKTLLVTTTVAKDDAEKHEKQTIHLISYYSAYDVLSGKLARPSESNLNYMPVAPTLWEAVQKSSLGGKIPIEDEAYYFLDSNYQLQNMSVLMSTKPDTDPKNPKLVGLPPTGSHSAPQPAQTLPPALSVPQPQQFGTKPSYVLPAPFTVPPPPVTFHADYVPQQLQQYLPRHSISDLKKVEDVVDLGYTAYGSSAPSQAGAFNHNYHRLLQGDSHFPRPPLYQPSVLEQPQYQEPYPGHSAPAPYLLYNNPNYFGSSAEPFPTNGALSMPSNYPQPGAPFYGSVYAYPAPTQQAPPATQGTAGRLRGNVETPDYYQAVDDLYSYNT